jgi:putative hydrolase of the HAD superfamily
VTVRAVTIDFWGTLTLESPIGDERYETRRLSGLAAVLREQGLTFSAAHLAQAYARSGEFLTKLWSAGVDVPVTDAVFEIVRALDPALPARITPETLAALVDAYTRPILLVPPTLDRGARPALTTLRDAGMRLAIVSNTMRTPGTTLRALLAKFDLLDCFDFLVFSDELRVRKPRPEIFRAALEALDADPATTVHVGDDPVLDVRGARMIGLKSIQVVGQTAARGSGADAADSCIARLDELPAAVARLNGA